MIIFLNLGDPIVFFPVLTCQTISLLSNQVWYNSYYLEEIEMHIKGIGASWHRWLVFDFLMNGPDTPPNILVTKKDVNLCQSDLYLVNI